MLPANAVRLVVTLAAILLVSSSAGAAIVHLTGDDFRGGAASRFGGEYQGEKSVNYVYATSTGELSTMSATFVLRSAPAAPMVLLLRGRDDDRPGPAAVRITLNGQELSAGPGGFRDDGFAERRFPVPPDALKAGGNELTITSAEPEGPAGNAPWFMISQATLMPTAALPLTRFSVRLPEEVRPFPEPAAPGAPRFKFRGTKGWAWTWQQYLEEVPHLKRADMNFLMNCYLSMADGQPDAGGGMGKVANTNRWWQPLPDEKKRGFERVVKACQESGITFCFAMHPQLFSARPMDLESAEDFEAFFQHFAWMQGLGVKWFSVSMDDVSQGHAGPTHARFVNKFLARLRAADPDAQLIFCPTVYANEHIAAHEDYLPALAREMHPDVYVFWTGPSVVPVTISRQDAEHYRDLVGHRLFIWENYPVNDNHATLHLGPITGRDPELCEVADGYMSNPHYPQSRANRVPLYTMADFAANPYGYDPARSIGQAIAHLTDSPAARRALADLMEAYPGNLIYGNGSTAFNPLHHEYARLTTSPAGGPIAALYLQHLEALLTRLRTTLPDEYEDAEQQLSRDVAALRERHAERFGPSITSDR